MKRSSISSKPDILGGALVVVGTRVPISVILYRLREGYNLDQIHDMYPHIPVKLFQKVIEELADNLSLAVTKNDQVQAFPQA